MGCSILILNNFSLRTTKEFSYTRESLNFTLISTLTYKSHQQHINVLKTQKQLPPTIFCYTINQRSIVTIQLTSLVTMHNFPLACPCSTKVLAAYPAAFPPPTTTYLKSSTFQIRQLTHTSNINTSKSKKKTHSRFSLSNDEAATKLLLKLLEGTETLEIRFNTAD